eukprot:gene4550-9029_t
MSVFEHGTMPTILCCICGVDIKYNPANMCVTCLRSQVDITEDIKTELTIHNCRSCKRYLCPPWREIELESKELMSVCLKKIPGLSKVKLIDAVWIWTEPHSMRLKIKLTIQKEVMNNAILQQAAMINFTIRNQQCEMCQASYATGAWHAIVAVRQRVSHKRTFFFLEQLLLKHNAHSDCIKIITFRDGMDFYFTEKQNAMRFIEFLSCHIPTKHKYARKLVSADKKDGTANYKHNFLIDIVPLCKDDLIVLPKILAKNLSDINPLVIVKSVSADVHIVDPLTCEIQEINSEKYWRHGFPAVMNAKDLVPFLVLSVEPLLREQRPSAKRRGTNKKLQLAECIVVRERDFGVTDTQYTVITHLGGIIREGHTVLGYDLTVAPWINDEEVLGQLRKELPDVILVRKLYSSKNERNWTLRNLDVDEQLLNSKEIETAETDMEMFMQELEADKSMRNNINLYKKNQNKKGMTNTTSKSKDNNQSMDVTDNNIDGDDDEEPDEDDIKLEELLDDMTLSDAVLDPDSIRVLSADEIANAASTSVLLESGISTNEFDHSGYDVNKFKFT